MITQMEKLRQEEACYRRAKESGNLQEQARWANTIGNLLMDGGQYLQALRWFKIDSHICIKYLSSANNHCFPAFQSIGEVYFRLQRYEDALVYQKKHSALAEDAGDLVERQRANTQLGRTYHDMYLNCLDQHQSLKNAKKYFNSAMSLAEIITENPPINSSSFVKEYIDAHNNIGLLQLDCDNLEEAKKIFKKAFAICSNQENEYADARARLYHNLGKIYTELRMWGVARECIEKDILICNQNGHCEGEAKGYINLGELHNCVQRYEEAILCYEKALYLAKLMEDEALVHQIDDNIKTVRELIEVMRDMKREEKYLKKLDTLIAQGKMHMRKCQYKKVASLDGLIDKSQTISAWPKVLEFAKMKKEVASELCYGEKIADSILVIGESYMKLRKFKEALTWYMKSLKIFKELGNLEGQALTQINVGHVLDSQGDYERALAAFTDGYRLAVQAQLPYVQLMAAENMHFSNLNRFDNEIETRRLQMLIHRLRQENIQGA